MKYKNIRTGTFIKRPNRFIAHVDINSNEEIVHVKNTGRCKEILIPGTEVYLEYVPSKSRKTSYSLIGAKKGNILINIDSQVPNQVVYDTVYSNQIKEFQDIAYLKREVSYKNSRFDLYFESSNKKGFIEVKGVTLEENGIARFPDAPTQRGRRHIMEMIEAVKEGYEGYLFFLIQMKGVETFMPNAETDPEFAAALKLASQNNVKILAYDCIVTKDEIKLDSKIPVTL